VRACFTLLQCISNIIRSLNEALCINSEVPWSTDKICDPEVLSFLLQFSAVYLFNFQTYDQSTCSSGRPALSKPWGRDYTGQSKNKITLWQSLLHTYMKCVTCSYSVRFFRSVWYFFVFFALLYVIVQL
jgi:hypothetical protein